MLQLIFCSVLNGRGQGKTRSHFRRGFLFCSSSGTWMSGDGDSTAGRRGKLTTGNISWGKMPQLIFCLRARKWCLAYSIRESKPFVRRDSSANDVCSIAEIIPFPASMIGETCSHESAVSNGSRWEISDRTRCPGAWRIGGWGLRRRTRNGEYQLRGFLATDIPNHCRQLKSFSKSSTGRETLRSGWSAVRNRSSCFPFAWLVMVVFPGGRFSQRTSFCLARCTGRLWCHPRQASRRDAACRARRDNGSHRSRRRA